MRLVVADTGPLHYLVLTGDIDILPALVGEVLVPPEVREEMDRPRTPPEVRAWIAAPPPWLRLAPTPSGATPDPALVRIGPGERAAILLAEATRADAVLLDDRAGVTVARARGLQALGTLGLLQRGARRRLLDLPDALARLTETNFRVRQALLDRLLAEDRRFRAATDGKGPADVG